METKKKATYKTTELTKVVQVFACNKLVVVIDRTLWVLLQFLSQVIQEGAPTRCGTQGLKDNEDGSGKIKLSHSKRITLWRPTTNGSWFRT